MDNKEPLALLSVISHMDNEELLEIGLKKRNKSEGSHILVEGKAARLINYTELLKDCYVEFIKTITDREEKVIFIQAIKEEKS